MSIAEAFEKLPTGLQWLIGGPILLGVAVFIFLANVPFHSGTTTVPTSASQKPTPTQTVNGVLIDKKHETSDPAKLTADLIKKEINGYRIVSGIAPLSEDVVLDNAAQIHALDMKNRHYYDHTTPEGVTSYTRIANAVGYATYSGENEDNTCDYSTAGSELARFIDSAEHNDNLLDTKYNSIGVGYVKSDAGVCNGYIVTDFARR